jgi:hypothetical protein
VEGYFAGNFWAKTKKMHFAENFCPHPQKFITPNLAQSGLLESSSIFFWCWQL